MLVQEHLNGELVSKTPLPALGLEPTTFRLESSCQGVTFHKVFTSLQLIPLPLVVASNLGVLIEVIRNTTAVID